MMRAPRCSVYGRMPAHAPPLRQRPVYPAAKPFAHDVALRPDRRRRRRRHARCRHPPRLGDAQRHRARRARRARPAQRARDPRHAFAAHVHAAEKAVALQRPPPLCHFLSTAVVRQMFLRTRRNRKGERRALMLRDGEPEAAHRRSRARPGIVERELSKSRRHASGLRRIWKKGSGKSRKRRARGRRQNQKRHINEGKARLPRHKQKYTVLLHRPRRKARPAPQPAVTAGPRRGREPLPSETNTPQCCRHAARGEDAICHGVSSVAAEKGAPPAGSTRAP